MEQRKELPKVPKGGSVYIDGVQYCDPTPVEMPLGYQAPESLQSLIARMCTDRMMQLELAKQNGGQDTEEEADDFDVKDAEELDFEAAGYQMTDMQEEYVDLEQLRKDSEAHAAREVEERVAKGKSEKKQRVKRSRKVEPDHEADVSDEEGTVKD